MSFDTRDDSFVRPKEVLGHFRRTIEREALQKMYDAFAQTWAQTKDADCPLDFKVNVGFGRVLPDDVVKRIEKELKDHEWTNYRLEVAAGQHLLLVKLEPEEAKPYART